LRHVEFFREDQIIRAVFLASGYFEAASELLKKHFNFDELSAEFRNYVFTPLEDQKLRKGPRDHEDLLKYHSLQALEERMQYLGIEACEDVCSLSSFSD